MLNRQELLSLSQFRDASRPVLSLYLKIDRQSPESKHLIRFKNLIQSLDEERERYDQETWEAIEADLERARGSLRDDQVKRGQSLALFACGDQLWQSFSLPYEIPSAIMLDEAPRVRPLFRQLQRFDRYLAILTDQQESRLFIVTPDGAEGVGMLANDISTTDDEGIWSQPRLARQREAHIHRHFKEAAEMAFSIYRSRGFNGIVLLGTEGTTSAFRETLHPYLSNLVLAAQPMAMESSLKEIADCVMEIARATRRQRQHELIERWEDEVLSAGQLATAGLEQTLRAAQQGQIMALLVEEEMEAAGGRCQQCEALLIEAGGECPYCSGEIRRLDDVVEALVASALHQDADVIFLASDGEAARLTPHGGIGATLRFAAA